MKFFKNNTIKIVLVLVIFYIFFSYGKVEYLTNKYNNEFKNLRTDFNGVPYDYYKIFSYSSNKAEVYYVSDDIRYMVTYKKYGGQWVKVGETDFWSSQGSADDIVWPYYN